MPFLYIMSQVVHHVHHIQGGQGGAGFFGDLISSAANIGKKVYGVARSVGRPVLDAAVMAGVPGADRASRAARFVGIGRKRKVVRRKVVKRRKAKA